MRHHKNSPLAVAAGVTLVITALVLAGCTSTGSTSPQPINSPTGVTDSTTTGPSTGASISVAVPPLTSDSAGDSGAGSFAPTSPAARTPHIEPQPVAKVSTTPKSGVNDLSPVDPLSVKVDKGTITAITLTNTKTGYKVKGTLAKDKKSWTSAEVLGYGKAYALKGTAKGTDGKTVPISGTYQTVTPKAEAKTTIYPTDDMEVGVAMPIVVKFGTEPADRALIEKHVKVTTDPKVEGAWAWIQHDGGDWGLDYRPKGYWPEGTQVHVEANLYGLEFADGVYGKSDITSDFTIGRNQVVVADVNSHNLVVKRDGEVVATYPASYGKGDGNPDLTTRSGIHVVNDKKTDVLMNNPKYGYTNQLEKWAVRISNNGEFIHANPKSVDAQGNTNVTHGCVNLSLENAEAYYDSAMIGDPVEVSGTDIKLAASDGDIFDYAVSWDEWLSLSALR